MLNVRDSAPNFSLLDQNGKKHTLEDYRGKWVLLYFYPKDDTPGCTVEACGIRDSFSEFAKANAVVLGVSTDDAKSHAKFVKKFSLPFTLLADTNKEVVNAYGVWGQKKLFGHEFDGTNRVSYLINPGGVILKVYPKVNPQSHAQEVLEDLRSFLIKR